MALKLGLHLQVLDVDSACGVLRHLSLGLALIVIVFCIGLRQSSTWVGLQWF